MGGALFAHRNIRLEGFFLEMIFCVVRQEGFGLIVVDDQLTIAVDQLMVVDDQLTVVNDQLTIVGHRSAGGCFMIS